MSSITDKITSFFDSTSTSLAGQLSTLVLLESFWIGFTLGVQEDNTDTATLCYEAFEATYSLITTQGVSFYAYAEAILTKGTTPTDIGFLMNLFETLTQVNLIFFNLYAECYIELLLIALGKIMNSQAQGGQFLMTIGISIYEYFYLGSGASVDLDTAVATFATTNNDTNAQDVGLKLGLFI
mmetsp:Transcript_10207/g.15541  ORF Transcript_10207/g.15541 Transcript_10207/m.15541 type:complete len:182 (-) Transcript_10207:105-650(-)